MNQHNLSKILSAVLNDMAMQAWPKFYQDKAFNLALFSGVLFVWLAHSWLPVFSTHMSVSWWLFISLVIWQPVVEELLFRGVIQGQILKYTWGQKVWLKLTLANIITSVLFVVLHLITVPTLWSLLVFIPSLLFGYFRDYYRSVYPSIALHSAYNLFVFMAVLIFKN